MTTLVFSHLDCLLHDTGPQHPERPDRVRAVMHALDETHFPDLVREEAPLADLSVVEDSHPASHVARLRAGSPDSGRVHLDADTVMSPGSLNAVRRSIGAVHAALDAVFGGKAVNAFCAIRPPGHHAEPDQPMGFCLVNNVVAGAQYAREKYGVRKVAVVDFDVHHGNGTQAFFENDPDLFYISSHQWPLYPGTGSASETGVADNIVNICLQPTSNSEDFRQAMSFIAIPRLEDFEPELIIISAGFDAHELDPLAHLNFTDDDYHWITAQLVDIAGRHCHGRIVSVLEGGYDLDGLAGGVSAHMRALMGD